MKTNVPRWAASQREADAIMDEVVGCAVEELRVLRWMYQAKGMPRPSRHTLEALQAEADRYRQVLEWRFTDDRKMSQTTIDLIMSYADLVD